MSPIDQPEMNRRAVVVGGPSIVTSSASAPFRYDVRINSEESDDDGFLVFVDSSSPSTAASLPGLLSTAASLPDMLDEQRVHPSTPVFLRYDVSAGGRSFPVGGGNRTDFVGDDVIVSAGNNAAAAAAGVVYFVDGGDESVSGYDEDTAAGGNGLNWPALLLFAIVVATIGGNVLVCLAVGYMRKLQNMFNYFLVSLALSDMLSAILVMPLSIIRSAVGECSSLVHACRRRECKQECRSSSVAMFVEY